MRSFVFVLHTLLCLFIGAFAVDTPLDLDGALEGYAMHPPPTPLPSHRIVLTFIHPRATVDDPTLFNSGGTITVNGQTVKIPKNLQIGFPAAFIPWRDFGAIWTQYNAV
jgi:hypothetical protein